MELQEDAYRIGQILETVDSTEIVKFLRKVTLANTEIRCQLALQHFLNVENALANKRKTHEDDDVRPDFLCIRHVLQSVSDEEIYEVLNILGQIPNRKYIAVKLLLRYHTLSSSRKRKSDCDVQADVYEASGSKLIKVAERNGESEAKNKNGENLELVDEALERKEPLRITIKSIKDRNGNDNFIVTSPAKVKCEPKTTQPKQEISPTTSTVIEDIDTSVVLPPLSPSKHIVDAVNGSSTPNLFNEQPSTSTAFQIKAALPSTSFNIFDSAAPSTHEPVEGPNNADVMLINESVEIDVHEEEVKLLQPPRVVDEKLVLRLVEMFPDASSEYLRDVCDGKEWSEQNLEEIVTDIISNVDYPKRPERQPSPPKDVDLEEQLANLRTILPNADPSYLHEKIDEFAGNPDGLQLFIVDALTTGQYPTYQESLRKQQISAQQRQYTTEFDVERFVELFPDPVTTFEDPDRKPTILTPSDKCYVKWFMRQKYSQLYVKDVNTIVEKHGSKNIVSIVQALNTFLTNGNTKRGRCIGVSITPDTQNIPLLQELAYFEHIDEIYNHIERKKTQAAQERQNAKELGLLQSCSCCYDDEVMPNDILTCEGGCRFCRDCIKKGTEVKFGEGKTDFPCLMDCGAEFSLQVLRNVLPPKVFSKLAQKKAVAEVKAAGVEDLETCPFCDFATIPVPEDRLFRCLNPDCMKESCRLCKEPSHVPLRCDEVEKDEAVKARTYIEDKMTEALIRECWKCNAKFIKEEGCNKMTCSCGAIMCYVCRKPVKDYKHFNGQGGNRFNLCPLYTDNFSVNEKNVLKAAEEAKKQIDSTQLINDPTADLQKHFGDKIKEAEKKAQRHAGAVERRGLNDQLRRQIRRQLMEVQLALGRQEELHLRGDLDRPLRVVIAGNMQPAHQQLPPQAGVPPAHYLPRLQAAAHLAQQVTPTPGTPQPRQQGVVFPNRPPVARGYLQINHGNVHPGANQNRNGLEPTQAAPQNNPPFYAVRPAQRYVFEHLGRPDRPAPPGPHLPPGPHAPPNPYARSN